MDDFKKLDDAIKNSAKIEQDSLLVDFDEAKKEYDQKNKKTQVKLLGKIYDIPSSIPYKLSLKILRDYIKVVDGKQIFDVPDDEIPTLLNEMLGKNISNAILDSDLELMFVAQNIIPKIMEIWGMGVKTNMESEKKTQQTQN